MELNPTYESVERRGFFYADDCWGAMFDAIIYGHDEMCDILFRVVVRARCGCETIHIVREFYKWAVFTGNIRQAKLFANRGAWDSEVYLGECLSLKLVVQYH